LRMPSNPETTSASKGFRKDTMALIAHSSNVVHTLTLDQVRKLFSGEYTNWSQVGGGDLPVNLITTRDVAARVESLLDTHIAPSAARVPFLSFLYTSEWPKRKEQWVLSRHTIWTDLRLLMVTMQSRRSLLRRITMLRMDF
jgi:hypothetical protein